MITVVVPTFNAGRMAHDLVAALQLQVPAVERVIIVDSGSRDGSTEVFRAAGFLVETIKTTDFDHGGTRNMGAFLARPAEIVVFLTQDAVLANENALASIIAPFEDEHVGLAYGRQLPRGKAGLIESHARLFNYPDIPGARTMADATALGIKAIFNSNSFAAYRVRALDEIGGFPTRIIMGEDQVAAARMLLAGWKVVYQAKAAVKHSHHYSMIEEFRRYFDIGVFHDSQRDLLLNFVRPEAEGQRFVRSEIGYLLGRSPRRIPEALLRNALKLLGYRLGQRHGRLPSGLKRRLAMNAGFFRSDARAAGTGPWDARQA